MNALVPILGSVALVVVAQVVLKLGAGSLSGLTRDDLRNPVRLGVRALRIPGVVVGLGLYALSAAVWIFVLAKTPLSYAYPFLGLTYVGVAVASVTVLKERFSTLQWIGLGFVLLGVLTVAASR
jgi:multidrug transporter EmrE-like cation transporter